MNKSVTTAFLLVGVLLLGMNAYGQITITESDIENTYQNSTWRRISDAPSRTIDLGTNSSSAQTFDFSGLDLTASTAETTETTYRPAAGQIRVADFPDAEFAMVESQVFPQGPFTLTITVAAYFGAEVNGAYAYGFAYRYQLSPPPPPGYPFPVDSTFIVKARPKALGLPLPLTYNGAPRTASDTLTDPEAGTEINTHIFTPAGFGTLLTPDGRSLQVIRTIIDHWETYIDEDQVVTEESRRKMIEFRALDGTTMTVEVDTIYESGPGGIHNYNYEYRTGALAVNPISAGIPEGFQLAQNYPNPFNPATVISFDLPTKEAVSLKVYDLTGREVATLIDGEELAPGSYEVPFNAGGLASGAYLYRFQAGALIETKMMSFVK